MGAGGGANGRQGAEGTSAKTYLASGTPLLRQDTRYSNFAPLTLGAPRAGLLPSLAPGESGGTLANTVLPRTLLATQPYTPCFLRQLTTPSHLQMHHSFTPHSRYLLNITPIFFQPSLIPGKGVPLAQMIGSVWAPSEKATILLI